MSADEITPRHQEASLGSLDGRHLPREAAHSSAGAPRPRTYRATLDISSKGHAWPVFHACFEQCERTPSRTTLRGWAFFTDRQIVSIEAHVLGPHASKQRHRFRIDYGIERSDVRDVWKCPAALFSGFRAQMQTPTFRAQAVRITFRTADGALATVTRPLKRARTRPLALAAAMWREATPANIVLAAGWILGGRFDRFKREVFALMDTDPARRARPPVPLERLLKQVAVPVCAPLERPVDIIIPVYNGLQYLGPLFDSLRRNTRGDYRLIVLDDASPDPQIETQLAELLAGFEPGRVLALRNATNQGFVRSINIAAAHARGDFVLLNADTVVPPGWLERLMAPIAADRGIASTTPMSNAATVCSFPEICVDNAMPRGCDVERVDAAFRRIRPGVPAPELPTGIGFCMGVNGDVWRCLGAFDAEAFGHGYGEENDWCLRARAAGFRNVLIENLFVQHAHGGSFESERKVQLLREHLAVLQQRYPAYEGQVAAFIEADVPAEIRTLAALLLAGVRRDPAPILILDHDLGGGATAYRDAMIARRLESGQPVLLVYSRAAGASGGAALTACLYLDTWRFEMEIGEAEVLRRLIGTHLPIGEIFYNNLVSHRQPLAMVDFAAALKRDTGARLSVALHDFYPLCPSYTLLNNQGAYCALPERAVCHACLPDNAYAANPQGRTIDAWRAHWGELMDEADEVACFSQDSLRHLVKIYPACAAKATVRPHALLRRFDRLPVLGAGGALEIAVVGGISYQKGAGVVAALARHLHASDARAHITVIGQLNDAPPLDNLTVTGKYDPAALPDLIEAHDINVCLVPSIWPETFSYVTAELMALNMPIVAFDIGAPGERLASYGRACVLPLTAAGDPAAIAQALGDMARSARCQDASGTAISLR